MERYADACVPELQRRRRGGRPRARHLRLLRRGHPVPPPPRDAVPHPRRHPARARRRGDRRVQSRGRRRGPPRCVPARRRDPGLLRPAVDAGTTCSPASAGAACPRRPRPISAAVAAAGFATWNLDLIFGAAAESDADWAATLDDVLGLAHPPPHLSRLRADRRARHAAGPRPGAPSRRRRPGPALRARRGGAHRRPATPGRRSPTGPGPGTSAGTTTSTGSRATTSASGRPPTRTATGVRWWNVRTPDRYIDAVEAGRSPEGGREVLTRRPARVRGALPLAAHAARRALGRASSAPRSSRASCAARTAGPCSTVRGRLLANEVSARIRSGILHPMTETAESPRRRRPDGEGGAPVPPPRLHLPLGRDLRRLPLHLRLRPARRQHAAQRQERLVARHGPSSATTWSGSTPPSSARPPSGRPRATWPPSPTPWSTARTATSAGAADKIDGVCPNCGSHDLTEARAFNLMFKTHAGPVEDEGHVAYLRPETAQGMFTNFANVLGTTRKKPPFGIAQVGKSFRNEITPQNFVFRTREFEQMEMEYFVPPDEAPEVVRLLAGRAHALVPATSASRPTSCACATTSRASSRTTRGARPTWSSCSPGAGTSSRASPTGATTTSRPTPPGSGVTLDYFDPQTNERYTPYVIEPAAGATRTMMAFLLAAYAEDEVGGEARTVLRLHWRLAPVPGGRAAAVEEGHARAAGPPGARPAAAALHVRLRRHPEHRQALPAPGRGRARRGA